MGISEQGLALIRQFEGFRAHRYRDAAGLLTIGYGHLLKRDELVAFALGIDESAARTLLSADVVKAELAVNRLINVALLQCQFDALVSFTFNLGAAVLQRSTLRAVLNRGGYEAVPKQLLRYRWAGGRPVAGLLRRRQVEARVFAGLVDLSR